MANENSIPADIVGLVDRAIGIGNAQGKIIEVPGGVPGMLVPEGYKFQSLEQQIYNDLAEKKADHPKRKIAIVAVDEPGSFLGYWGLYSDEDSQAFAISEQSVVRGILDYHGVGSEKQAGWKQHQVVMTLKHSDEWNEWAKHNRQNKTQSDFAEFLEDHAPDIVDPSAATFIEMARDLRAKSDVQFDSKITMQSGASSLTFIENVQAGSGPKGELQLPERFKIAIQIYLGMPKITMEARLRFRISSGKLVLWYDLYRMNYEKRTAFEAVVNRIQDGIKKQVFIGQP